QRLAEDRRVQVTGRVDDVRSYYAGAAASIVPLRVAGGVRMKILEGLAFGMPMVASTVGPEGLGLDSERELLIADTPQEFADAAIRLLRDRSLRDRLSSQARQTAVQRFSWQAVVRRLEGIYDSVVAAHTVATSA